MSVNIYHKDTDELQKVAGFVDASTITGMSREIADLTVSQAETKANVLSLDMTITGAVSDAYDDEKTYVIGEYCIDGNQMWKCKVPCKGQKPSEGTYWTARKIADELKNKMEEYDIGSFSPSGSVGITGSDGYMSGFGPFVCFTCTLNFSSVTKDTIMLLGQLRKAESYPLKVVALACYGVGGAASIQNPSTAYMDTDGKLYFIPKFSDTGAKIIISGTWRVN